MISDLINFFQLSEGDEGYNKIIIGYFFFQKKKKISSTIYLDGKIHILLHVNEQ